MIFWETKRSSSLRHHSFSGFWYIFHQVVVLSHSVLGHLVLPVRVRWEPKH